MASSDNHFNAMQEEAVRRVREMQRKSRSMVENSPEETPPPQTVPKPPATNNKNHQNQQHNLGGLLGGLLGSGKQGELFNLGGIKIDEEKALIAMLIYILYKQGADVKLLLGLGYLLI